MYGPLWRARPGPRPVKRLLGLILIAAVFLRLMVVVFPWVSTLMPYNDVAV